MHFAHSRRSALLLALSASLGLAACGGGGGESGTPVNSDPNGWNAVTTLKTTDTVVGTGTGAAIDAGKVAPVIYTGWVYDVRAADTKGTKIDSNAGGTPFSFVLGTNAVIQGFEQGVTGMKSGGKRTVTIPAGLAYGATGKSPSVPANAALVFDLELDPMGWMGVTTLKTQDNVVGTGALASAGKSVKVAYTLWFYDARVASTKGTQLETNANGYTFTLGTNAVIAGFEQGVTGMKVGGKRTLTIPASLAYGNAGQNSIPGGAALVFDIELMSAN